MPIRTAAAAGAQTNCCDKPPGGKGADAPEPDPAARDAAHKARAGSAKLLAALLRYGATHGLPNLTPAQCLAMLRFTGKRRKRPARAGQPGVRAAGQARGSAGKAGATPRTGKSAHQQTGEKEGRRHGTRG